jgi:DNA-binding response OmpR family regulator
MSAAEAAGLLKGRRILIVEDRYLIAAEIADEVSRLGGDVLGPARNLAAAAEVVSDQRPDLAVLDVNLDGEMVYPLAEKLARGGTPIVFLTGYDDEILPLAWRDWQILVKPVSQRRLREALARALGAPPPPRRS